MQSEVTERVGLKVNIRWMLRRDLPEVLAIEGDSFKFPWCEEEFLRVLRRRTCIGMVAEHGERVVGFMVYETHKGRLQVLDFAVDPSSRGCGVGTQMAAKLVGKLSPRRRTRLAVVVRETDLRAQTFFRRRRFLAERVLRGRFPDTGEDGYVMAYEVDPDAE